MSNEQQEANINACPAVLMKKEIQNKISDKVSQFHCHSSCKSKGQRKIEII